MLYYSIQKYCETLLFSHGQAYRFTIQKKLQSGP